MNRVSVIAAACCILTAGNLFATYQLSQRLDNSTNATPRPDMSADPVQPARIASTPSTRAFASASALAGISHIDNISRQRASEALRERREQPPAYSSASAGNILDAALSNEPRNSPIESRNTNWLQSTLQQVLTDDSLPAARFARTNCQGRRCVVSAEFPDERSARAWSNRFLLAGGGQYLSAATPVTHRQAGGNGTTLQIFFY